MTKDNAIKLALEALEESKTNNDSMEFHDRKNKAITVLREALIQREPVAQWQLRHHLHTDGIWENCTESEASLLQKEATFEIRRLYTSPQPAQQEQKPVALREALREAAAAALTSVYVCGRVWSAWHIGTMTEDDFSPASECDWLLDEIVHAVATAAPQPAQRKPLTNEEITKAFNEAMVKRPKDASNAETNRLFVRAIEAAHGIQEKNT